jgi:hypothetical protein
MRNRAFGGMKSIPNFLKSASRKFICVDLRWMLFHPKTISQCIPIMEIIKHADASHSKKAKLDEDDN